MKKVRTTNPELIKLINSLRKRSKENNSPIWLNIAKRLAKPRRRGVAVNISRLNRYTNKSETIIVPGKVLAAGEIDHPIIIAALSFSKKAEEKIRAARGKCLTLEDLVKKNPVGSNVKIIA